MSYLVSGMAEFVNGDPNVIISDLILSGDTFATYVTQTGIKHKTKVLDMGDGSVDPSNGSYVGVGGYSGSARLSDVEIQVTPLFIKEQYSKEDVEQKLAQLAETKGSDPEEVVFSDLLMALKGENLVLWNEKALWRGATDSSLGGVHFSTYFDGIVKQLIDDASTLTSGIAPAAYTTDASAIAYVEAMVDAMPEEFIEIDTILAMSPTNFAKYRRALYKQTGQIDLNTVGEGAVMEVEVPGTNVTAKSTAGLTGTNYMVLTRKENIVCGTDLESETDTIQFIWQQAYYAYDLFASYKLGVKVVRTHEAVLNQA